MDDRKVALALRMRAGQASLEHIATRLDVDIEELKQLFDTPRRRALAELTPTRPPAPMRLCKPRKFKFIGWTHTESSHIWQLLAERDANLECIFSNFRIFLQDQKRVETYLEQLAQWQRTRE